MTVAEFSNKSQKDLNRHLWQILGEDYDFPQTNQSIQEIVEDDCNDDLQEEQQENTANMEQLAKDQQP